MELVVLGLAWLGSVAAVGVWHAPPWMAAAWLAASLPVAYRFRGRRTAAWFALAAVIALAGGIRFDSWRHSESPDWVRFIGSEVVLHGTVTSEPDPGPASVSYDVRVDSIEGAASKPGEGSVRATLNQYARLLPGDQVSLKGTLADPPVFATFDYRSYLAWRGVFATMLYPAIASVSPGGWSPGREATGWRLELDRALQRSLPEPEASLAAGIAFGRDGNLPDETKSEFRSSGLAHIVAVSGSNVTLVAAVAFALFVPAVGRRYALLPAALMIAGYVTIAGLSPSVVRAGVMAAIFLFGAWLGRPQAGLPALAIAAVIMTALQPAVAADAGFQLSLAATAGLLVFAPWIRVGLERASRTLPPALAPPGAVLQVAALSTAANIATLPIVFVTFGRVSLIGPLANIVVEPLFVLAFGASALTALLGWAWAPAGWAAGIVAYYPLAFILWLARTAAALPGASVPGPTRSADIAPVAYAPMLAAGWFAYRRLAPVEPAARPAAAARRVRHVVLAGSIGGIAVAVLLLGFLPARGPGELELTVLDVGQGDAILIRTPHGTTLLIDGGPSQIQLARQLSAVLPHWQHTIRAAFVTHPQEDHIGGIPGLIDRYDVKMVFDNGRSNTTQTYAAYELRGVARSHLAAGATFMWDGVTVEVLWPPAGYITGELNDTSLVLRIRYGQTTIVLTGDFEAPAQDLLMASTGVAADVLKVPHHGSKTTDPAFLDAVDASVAIISVGANNLFGHPSAETLDALAGSPVYRTDRDGRVTVRSDGTRLTVSTEK